ncbi:MAG: metal-dependent transcriptional regulator [Chloroflexi bacterium]|nr:metal-dependent transcriptional regulator [Chloroflexota bacterium]
MTNPFVTLTITAIVVAVGLWLFWPDKGLFWRWQRARQMTRRVLIEDTLKHMHDCEYHGRVPSVQSIAGALNSSVNEVVGLLTEMQAHELITFEGDRLELTPHGRDYALHIIRAHRLWERYLADKTGYAAADWHSQSERREHHLSRAEADALAQVLGHPRFDPHGDPIPTASGDLFSTEERFTLLNFPLNQYGRIVHLEDEPETVYAQLIAEGLNLGMTILVTEITPQRVRFWADGDEHVLAPILAANISVVSIQPEEEVDTGPYASLSQLKLGQTARVTSISHLCRGAERRRFLDLGILPGTIIRAEMISPSGDPTAYRIRGALIGLRKEQAGLIYITRDLEPAAAQVRKMEAII